MAGPIKPRINNILSDPRVLARIRTITLIILNIYFLKEYYEDSYIIGNQIELIIYYSTMLLWILGVLRDKPYISCTYYIIAGTMLIIHGYDYYASLSSIIYSSIWMLLTSTLTTIVFDRSYRRKHILSPLGITAALILIAVLYGLYLIIGYIVSGTIIDLFDTIIANTHKSFRSFYEILISTRTGALIFSIISIFVIYVILEEYITNLLAETTFLNKPYAFQRIKSYIVKEIREIVSGKTDFQKVYVRALLFVIMFYVYGLLYPLIDFFMEIFPFKYFSYFLWFALWFFVSTAIYQIFSERAKRNIVPVSREDIIDLYKRINARTHILAYISLVMITAYIAVITFLSHNLQVVLDVVITSIGLKQPLQWGARDQITFMLTHYYIYYSNWVINYLGNNYFYRVAESYELLAKIMKGLITFLWG